MGIWNREAIEGFVVRTHLVDYPSRDAIPYKPGSTIFFKVQFDELYMMYRDWREITKKLLSTKGPSEDVQEDYHRACGHSGMWYVFFLFFFAQKADLLKVKHRSLSPSSIFLVSDTLSDDVKGKKNPAPRFIQNVRELLKEHDMVIADKYVVLILFLYYQSLTL